MCIVLSEMYALLRRVLDRLFKRRKIFSRNTRGNSPIFTRSIPRAHLVIHQKTYNVGGRRCNNKKMITIYTDTTSYVLGTRVSVYYNKPHQRKKQRRGNVCQAIARKKERVFLRPHSWSIDDSRAQGSRIIPVFQLVDPRCSPSTLDSILNSINTPCVYDWHFWQLIL